MPHQPVDLLEGIWVDERLNALKGGHLALGMLLVNGRLAFSGGIGATSLQDSRLAGRGSALGTLRLG